MRLHRNLVIAVINTLYPVFNKGHYADKAVEKTLKSNKKWGSRDRAFIAETVYDIVRWKRLYAELAGLKEPFNKEDLYLLFQVWAVLKEISLPDWEEFKANLNRAIPARLKTVSRVRSIRESIPDWLDELGLKELGEERWEMELKTLNQKADVVLRTNTLKTNPDKLRRALEKENIVTRPLPGYPDALVLEKRGNVLNSKAFKSGWFEIQDASSQLVAPFVEPAPGMCVIDACAGAGGKTLHLACMMKAKGELIAMDIYRDKLNELNKRAKRNGISNIKTICVDSEKVVGQFHNKAHRVLIDAPCTGLGVLRRNPDAKWKLKPGFVNKVRETQKKLLRHYSSMVASGGQLIYATCSILESENSAQVQEFLASGEGRHFSLEQEVNIWPSEGGYDGFYMARMRKK